MVMHNSTRMVACTHSLGNGGKRGNDVGDEEIMGVMGGVNDPHFLSQKVCMSFMPGTLSRAYSSFGSLLMSPPLGFWKVPSFPRRAL